MRSIQIKKGGSEERGRGDSADDFSEDEMGWSPSLNSLVATSELGTGALYGPALSGQVFDDSEGSEEELPITLALPKSQPMTRFGDRSEMSRPQSANSKDLLRHSKWGRARGNPVDMRRGGRCPEPKGVGFDSTSRSANQSVSGHGKRSGPGGASAILPTHQCLENQG